MVADTPITCTQADVRAAASGRSFERGREYLAAVGDLVVRGRTVTARVRGTREYRVVLTIGGSSPGGLRGQCDCPQGIDGHFCKHCVAVGLKITQNEPVVATRSRRRRGSRAPGARTADLFDWLASLTGNQLIDTIWEQACTDYDWRLRLELRAASAAADVPRITEITASLLAGGVDEGGLAAYALAAARERGPAAGVWPYARCVREVARVVDDLAQRGHAAEATEVAESALGSVASGWQGGAGPDDLVADAVEELGLAHLAACAQAPPGALALADFLVGQELSPAGVRADRYAGMLGEEGLARLRERLTAAWRADPGGPAKIALERLLTAAGDVDGLVAVLAADLDQRGEAHLRIAGVLDRAGRAAEALDWAERGLRTALEWLGRAAEAPHRSRRGPRAALVRPGRADAATAPVRELAGFVAARYAADGRGADALRVRRDAFAVAQDLESYRRLREAAERTGTWPEVRPWARGLLRARADTAPPWASRPAGTPGPALIDALIDDGDVAGAWDTAPGIASDDQWLRLAGLIAPDRPAEAGEVYQRLADPLKRVPGDVAYQKMARLLASARDCHERAGTRAAFDSYLRALRADLERRRKRKLLAILDARGL